MVNLKPHKICRKWPSHDGGAISVKPSPDWINARLPTLAYVLPSHSVLVTTLKREDINLALVIAIGVLLRCEYYIYDYK